MISKQLSESSQKSAIAFPLSKGLPLQPTLTTRIETTTGDCSPCTLLDSIFLNIFTVNYGEPVVNHDVG
jgi:hypothetical protein